MEITEESLEQSYAVEELILERERERDTLAVWRSRDFLVQKCGSCDGTMTVGKGDVLFAGAWYHRSCWKLESKHGGPVLLAGGPSSPK